MTATSLDLSQIRTDALSSAATFRTLIGLGTLATQSPTGTPSASNFLRGDYSWQTIDLSGYVPYAGANANLNLGSYTLTSAGETIVNGTSATKVLIHNTYSGAGANYERAKLAWESNTFVIGTEIAGTSVTSRNIAFTGGNVGIGTTSPSAKLHITNGGLFVDHDYNSVSVPGGGLLGMYLRGNSGVSPFGFSAASTGNISASAPLFYYSWIAATKLGFASYDGSSANQFIAFDYTSKNIGISNTSPAAKLDISDTTSAGSGSLAASTLNIASTWSTTGTPTLVKCNVVDTSSNAASLLMDLQVGGSSKFSASKNGVVQVGSTSTGPWYEGRFRAGAGAGLGFDGSGNMTLLTANNTQVLWVTGARVLGWANFAIAWASTVSSGGNLYDATPDLFLTRDAAGTLAQRNSTNPQTFRLYRTASGSPGSDYERLALSSTTYSSAVYQTIAAESAGTGAANINMVVSPKGTGAFMLQTPDGTATNGNARGANAIDLQIVRNSATQVASGNSSVAIGHYNYATSAYSIAVGYNCTSSGNASVALGYTNTASGEGSFSVGVFNTASGQYGATALGRDCTASGSYGSLAIGHASLANRRSSFSLASGNFSTVGDAQRIELVLRIKTTDATATTLMLDGSTTRLTIPSGKVFAFVAKISGIKSDGSAVAFYTRKGCIKNVGGATSLVGSIETIGTDTEDNASTDVAITADDTNDALQINVTGIAAETWRWVAVVEGVEIGYGT